MKKLLLLATIILNMNFVQAQLNIKAEVSASTNDIIWMKAFPLMISSSKAVINDEEVIVVSYANVLYNAYSGDSTGQYGTFTLPMKDRDELFNLISSTYDKLKKKDTKVIALELANNVKLNITFIKTSLVKGIQFGVNNGITPVSGSTFIKSKNFKKLFYGKK